MNTKVRRLLCLMLVTALFVAPWPALADPPEQGHWDVEGSSQINCGAFVVNMTGSEVGHWIIYARDAAGIPVSSRLNYSGQYTYTNPANGKVLLGHAAGSTIVDLPNAEVEWIGLIIHIRLPQGGVVHTEAGQVAFNPFTMELYHDAGQNNFPNGWVPVMCELLAD